MKLKYLCVNANGLQSPGHFDMFLKTCDTWRNKQHISVFMAQEHNLNPDRVRQLKRDAGLKCFHLSIAFAPPVQSPNGLTVHWGGTLILTDTKSAIIESGTAHEPGAVSTKVDMSGEKVNLLCVYAPSDPSKRIDFFTNKLPNYLTSDTIAAGDWNCVPDVTLDIQQEHVSTYRNIGGTLLEQRMNDKGLCDVRREQLGDAFEPTRTGNTQSGTVASRLDRWYVPTDEDESWQWSFEVRGDFVWKKTPSDHFAVVATMETNTGEMGHDRKTIRDSLLLKAEVQNHIIDIMNTCYRGNASESNKWVKAHNLIRSYLLAETAKLRKKERIEIRRQRSILQILKAKLNIHGPTPERLNAIKDTQKEIYVLSNPEQKELLSAAASLNSFDRSDNCTKAFFLPYKSCAKQNWINNAKIATWEEDKDPVFTGTTKTVSEVPGAFKGYYGMLYADKSVEDQAVAKAMKLLKKKPIFETSKKRLDEAITTEEVQAAMERTALGKSAGPDRIPGAMYRILSSHFAERLANLLNEALEKGSLPPHMLEGDITVLYKKGDRDDPRNYRPITLLNADYKVFAKVLASRMKTVVHEFTSSTQKGFVPRELIQDCTTLLHMVEAYINDEPTERQGIFLFFDMEKAFDRVSYAFLNKSLEATGFGPNFRSYVKMMYNVENAPKRRLYINGYYSEWFRIKSGVAQGCPCSPLLFLFVAEALKMFVGDKVKNKEIKGIKIGPKTHFISQFADDTTLLLRRLKDIKPAEEAIEEWGKATGMRENKAKREGLAMGKLRHKQLPAGTKWANDGEWVKSLGNPIGNDLDAEKFWAKKLEAVKARSKAWLGLYRNSYFGRNLVVQAMYFGSLRYWLYTLPMSKATRAKIQAEADQLWWAKDPELDQAPKRFRRFVAKETAIGPRSKGGLGNMNWDTHVTSFTTSLIHRYVHPSKAAWKDVLDWMLWHNKKGEETHPEGSMLLYCKLPQNEKGKLLHRLPKKAKYIRNALREFWELKLVPAKPADERFIGSESLWFNHSFDINADWRTRNYFRETLQTTLISDIMDRDSNRPGTRQTWKDWINEYDSEAPDDATIRRKVDQILSVIRQIPDAIKQKLRDDHVYTSPEPNEVVAWVHNVEDEVVYSRYIAGPPAQLQYVWLDCTGYPHDADKTIDLRDRKLYKVATWNDGKGDVRIGPPRNAAFPINTIWKLGDRELRLDALSIEASTQIRQENKMKPPASEEGWRMRLPGRALPFPTIWKLKPMYVSRRDTLTWMKLKHRNLYVANRDRTIVNNACLCCGTHPESMGHLSTCIVIRRDFWDKIISLIENLGLDVPGDREAYILLGRQNDQKTMNREAAALIALGWRCLYAEITRARINNEQINLKRALKRTFAMIISRTRAYGEKWLKWFRRTCHSSKSKLIPRKHQKYKMIKISDTAEYTIAQELLDAHLRA